MVFFFPPFFTAETRVLVVQQKEYDDHFAAVGLYTAVNLQYDPIFSSKQVVQSQIKVLIKQNSPLEILVA